MAELKMKTVREIDYFDLRQFTKEHLGREYNVASDSYDYPANDSAITASAQVWPDDPESYERKWDKPEVDKFISGEEHQCRPGAILSELCSRNLIPVGDYVISVSW